MKRMAFIITATDPLMAVILYCFTVSTPEKGNCENSVALVKLYVLWMSSFLCMDIIQHKISDILTL